MKSVRGCCCNTFHAVAHNNLGSFDCKTLQHTATCCNTLLLQHTPSSGTLCDGGLELAHICNTLQHTSAAHSTQWCMIEWGCIVNWNAVYNAATYCNILQHAATCCNKLHAVAPNMGWLRFVGSLKLLVSFAEYCLLYGALLQKRPVILRSLLIVATP